MNFKKVIIAVLGLVILAGIIFIFTQKSNNQPNKVAEKAPAPPANQIVKMSADSVHVRQPDGTIEAKFYTAPINYQDAEGNWHPIDTTLKLKGDIYKGDGTKVSVGKDGTVRVDGMSLTQRTTRIGYLNPQAREFTPIAELKEGKIKENKFIREAGSLRHELTLFENGLKEELTLSEKPTGFRSGDLLVMETQVSGMNLPQGFLEKDLRVGDLIFPAPTSEDAKQVKGETKRFVKDNNGKQYLYTGVPVSWLAEAVYPVVIDPDFTGSTADGDVYGADPTYSTARSTSSTVEVTGPYFSLGQKQVFVPSNYVVWRGALKFDTSSIPDGTDSTITQVNLKLAAVVQDNSNTDFDVQIVDLDWSANEDFSDSTKRENFYDGCLSGTADSGSPWRNTSGMSLNTLYTSPNLSTSWVSKTGSTYYCLRSSLDYSNTPPFSIFVPDYIYIAAQENATSGYRPVLTVTYTISAPGTPDMTGATDTGQSTDNITKDTTPDFTISCASGASVVLYDNTTNVGSGTCASSTVTITSSALSEGTHATMNAKQTDTNGIVSAASGNLSITIDVTAPTAAITYSINHAVKSGDSLTITATFNEAMANGPIPSFGISGANTVTSFTTMTKTDTTHYYYVHTVQAGDGTATVAFSGGTDVAANDITAAPTSGADFTVDNTAPTTPGTPTTTTPTKNTKPTFTWTASTDTGGSGVDYYSVDWSQSSTFSSGVTSTTTTSTSCALSTTTCGGATGLSEDGGTWYVRVKAFDVAGNSSGFSANGSVLIYGKLNFQGVDMQGVDIK